MLSNSNWQDEMVWTRSSVLDTTKLRTLADDNIFVPQKMTAAQIGWETLWERRKCCTPNDFKSLSSLTHFQMEKF